jgi:HK97 gp10 family phage protein
MAAAPAKVERALITVLDEAADEVARIGKMLAPFRTGRLKDSIHVVKHGGLLAEVSTGTRYAEYVEYGTSKMAPEPFMRPAADLVQQHLPDRVAGAGADFL